MSLLTHYAFRRDPTTQKHIVNATLVDAEKTRNTLRLDGPCILCRELQSLTVAAESLIALGQGEYAQKCFPNLTPGQREFLVYGICDTCSNKMLQELDDVRDG